LNSHSRDRCAIGERAQEGLPGIVSTALVETIPATVFVEPEPRGGFETILLVEDEAFVRKVTAEVLESAGYKLLIARNGAEALDACHKSPQPVDLLLADVVMPGMSGRELADEFEGLCPHARILLMSGYAGQLAWCQLSPYGDAYLAKPFSVRGLLKKVREVLDANPFASGTLA
jgi:two-component system cell cycle sensor histidine kinase/response regulator CckA